LVFDLSREPVIECQHPREIDRFDLAVGVAFVALRPFVSVVVSEDRLAADPAEVEAVIPPARIGLVARLSDGHRNNVTGFDSPPVFDGDVGRHPLPYVFDHIIINLWGEQHRMMMLDSVPSLRERDALGSPF